MAGTEDSQRTSVSFLFLFRSKMKKTKTQSFALFCYWSTTRFTWPQLITNESYAFPLFLLDAEIYTSVLLRALYKNSRKKLCRV